ncbi:DNA mismatch repair endonuclease MutL, partial [Leptolyngbya sp. FACHB-36]|uniref:DNA mismatch repair endonuclease MutL n=1 Tax=Leptolyngbya sp. FACHB-36 TaxID=2692808 RepID=UPI0016810F29
MTVGIRALPIDVVHLIAAGEVIDSLAAVVRELAENSLDAEATRIVISLYPEQGRVRVADNGSGMTLDNLRQAAAPHTTSKIRGSADLERITSLGFRGEALHSLTQLATLEIASRSLPSEPEDAIQPGWKIAYDTQGQPVTEEPVAIAPGTIVTASQLFANWSVRREGLPPIAQQLRAVQMTVHQLALCHPQVTWQVQQNDREWFNLWAGNTARQLLPQILRDVQLGDLRELRLEISQKNEGSQLKGEGNSPRLTLVVGLPDRCHRHRPDWIRVALNRRIVKLPEIEQTILSSFRRALPRDRFPVCIVHLQVPPEQIDWNRHPAKSEVYLHQLDSWRERVADAIDQALRLDSTALPDSLYSTRIGKLIKAAESDGGYRVNREISTSSRSHAPTPLRAIAQVHNRYVLGEHPTGVWLIEQHIAHERVLYEQLCDRWQLVALTSPIVLNHLRSAQVEQLQRLGVEVEPFGEQLWMV